jgi:ubiquinone/menaquinone biosynthesis C-methylase UbiE
LADRKAGNAVLTVNGNRIGPRGAAALFAAWVLLCLPVGLSGESPYTYGKASRDGTGKFYMGREIAQVMGHRGAAWLERSEREAEEAPDVLVDKLELDGTEVVADIGAGTGYFSFRLSPLVPKGRVFAVDIEPEMLDIIAERMERTGVENVIPVRGSILDPKLPVSEVDVALIVDAYHEFSHPYEMMRNIVRSLRPGGRVVLVEYRAEDPDVPIKPLHKMSERQARMEMEAVGLVWVGTSFALPWQHLMVFEKPDSNR